MFKRVTRSTKVVRAVSVETMMSRDGARWRGSRAPAHGSRARRRVAWRFWQTKKQSVKPEASAAGERTLENTRRCNGWGRRMQPGTGGYDVGGFPLTVAACRVAACALAASP